jgi:Coenzyme PQQ synthesis protein D (PqqD)
MGRTSALTRPGVAGYELDDDAVLFLEHSGELLRLNPTAALIWRGFASGLSTRDIVQSLVQVLDAPAVEVERDVAGLMTSLQAAGVLDGSPRKNRAAHPTKMEVTLPAQFHNVSHHSDLRERCYRLVEFSFRLRIPSALESDVDQLLAHLCVPDARSPGVLLEVLRDGKRWLLLRESRQVDQCSAAAGVIPMLHSSILLMAYGSSACMAAVHAAAVTRGDDCVLMPATSGSGKSTLTAALLSQGFGYGSDDLALLTHEPVRIRPVPTCLGLKSGSWRVLDGVLPAIRHLSTHLRADGKQVRYLPPPVIDQNRNYNARAIVFPIWSPGQQAAQINRIGAAEGLSRLTASGYDLRNRINAEIVECLIRWISGRPCFELRYDAPTDAALVMSALME